MRRSVVPTLGLALLGTLLAPALAAGTARLSAQDRDVELVGRIYGTRPPAAYFELRERDPRAFRMERGMAAGRGLPASGVRSGVARLRAGGGGGAAGIAIGGDRVQGPFRFPVILGLFADSPPPQFARAQVQSHFFDGPNPDGTIRDLYREMSGGAVELAGVVTDWGRSSLTGVSVAGSTSGLGGSARVGEFIMELLSQLPWTTDWGRYDNDGPDGFPNSGDDDGYVDVLAVMHPTSGAECGGAGNGSRIWSHKWSLGESVGQVYVTQIRTPDGRRIRIDDYTIQPVQSCSEGRINEIGVFAHELGHGFGLPDLYASGHAGVGRWDLMGTGSWGCSSAFEPERPCHMGAWSKAMLGWLDVDVLPFGSDWLGVTLGPVETTRRALAIPAGDGSGEYFLLENRQRIGFDGSLPETGLLVWHIDPWLIEGRLPINEVNDNANRMGVWLRQADGLNQLGMDAPRGGNRGDAGDPFNGEPGRNAFHAGTDPASFTHTRSAFEQQTRALPRSSSAGVTVTEIARSGQRITFRTLARYQTLRVRSAGDSAAEWLFTVDGTPHAASEASIRSAPYQHHTIEAAAGAELSDGIRQGFSGWRDAPTEERVRSWTTGFTDAELVAVYGGPREVRLRVGLEGGRFGVEPGAVSTVPASPGLWFDEGTEVALRAEPTVGFVFHAWQGVLAGQPNPALILMDQPKDAAATFQMVFELDPAARVEFPAATEAGVFKIELEVSDALGL